MFIFLNWKGNISIYFSLTISISYSFNKTLASIFHLSIVVTPIPLSCAAIYNHCNSTFEKLIKYVKKGLNENLPVLIAIKSRSNPSCAHIVPVIRYSKSEFVYFDPDPNHFGEFRLDYKNNDLENNLMPGKFDTLIFRKKVNIKRQ